MNLLILSILVGSGVAVTPLLGQGNPPVISLVLDWSFDAGTAGLASIGPIAVSRKGVVAVTDDHDMVIYFVDSDGKLTGKTGRRGEGPGEFIALTRLFWVADTLFVPGEPRVTSFSAAGKLIRSSRIQAPGGTLGLSNRSELPTLRGALLAALSAEGSGVLTGILPVSSEAATRGETGLRGFASVKNGWAMQKFIGTVPAERIPECRGTFCFTSSYAVSPNGRWISHVSYDPEATTPTIAVISIDTNGDTVFKKRHPYRPVTMPKSLADSLAGTQAGRTSMPYYIPKSLPPFRRLLVGDDGTVWIARWPLQDRTTWDVLSPHGEIIGTVTLPESTVLKVVGGSTVWAVKRDLDGLPTIQRLRVQVPR